MKDDNNNKIIFSLIKNFYEIDLQNIEDFQLNEFDLEIFSNFFFTNHELLLK
jgi:hypothetical protein